MLRWIHRILMIALLLAVGALAATAVPALGGGDLSGPFLLAHMFASGVLVIGLPVFALIFLLHLVSPRSRTLYWSYVGILASGVATIATVFLCMLPIPSTEQMHELITIHGWAGFAMVPAVIVFAIGLRSHATTA
ncbi:MAG: hypothetical protein AAFU85_22730 [Planctomycetota bacterium]